MRQFRVLSEQDTKELLDIKQTVAAVERAYSQKSSGRARLFPIISEEIFAEKAEMDIKSGMLKDDDVFGMKMVSWFGENTRENLPSITGMTMIFDLVHGFPKGLISSGYLTGMRTGAAGALGIKYLGCKKPKVLMIVGTGRQAVFQIAATISIIKDIEKVLIYNPLSFENACSFKDKIKQELEDIKEDILDVNNVIWRKRIESIKFEAVESPREGAAQSDAIITITPARKPLLYKEWIKEGTHFSCMGADVAGKQEIDSSIFEGATIFVDDLKQAVEVGETRNAVSEGIINKDRLREIGEVINGEITGRKTEKEITIFDGTGIALQDLALSKYLIDKAEALNIGKLVEI